MLPLTEKQKEHKRDYENKMNAIRRPHSTKLEQHHIKYKEIHGEDIVVLLTPSEHRRLHARLRREGKCKVPGKELRKISEVARWRTDSYKSYRKTEKYKATAKRYKQNHEQTISFDTAIFPRIHLIERIVLNKNNGNVYVCSHFCGNRIKLPLIREKHE